MNIFIKNSSDYYAPIRYVLKLIEKNRNVKFHFTESAENAAIIWDDRDVKSEYIDLSFYENLINKPASLKHSLVLDSSLKIKNEVGKRDLIATIFYMVNCLQELIPDDEELDSFGRFKYTSSYQSEYNTIEENSVENLIDDFCEKHEIKGVKTKSTFFISHDIDTIYGSFLQDGLWALKNMRIDLVLKLILFELSKNPHWKNIDQIIKLNNDYNIRSTFFWLVNKGKGLQGIKNADYTISKVQDLVDKVNLSGNVNGLHKSCSEMSINDELKKGNLKTTYNRYHFLNFLPHKDWRKISDSKLNFDCSLGFAERYGFRNSYGKAFQPFDIERAQPYDFIEAPLNFMDGTFHRYMKIPTDLIGKIVIDFYEENPLNCDFSLLWHNTYFTNYKYNSFLKEYKRIASFIYENKIECVGPKELIEKNKMEW